MATRKQKPKATAKKKATAKSKAVARRKPQELQVPTGVDLMAQYAQQEQSDFTQSDLSIPFLRVLQKGSPQCDKGEAEYIKGAQAGMIFNTVTETIMEEVPVIVCAYKKHLVEWKPRSEGGGFVASYDLDDPIVHESEFVDGRNNKVTPAGNDLVETACFYVLYWDEESEDWSYACIALSATGLSVARKWCTQLQQIKLQDSNGRKFTPPIYAFVWTIDGSDHQKNDKGSWERLSFERGELVLDQEGEEVFDLARTFREACVEHNVSADLSKFQEYSATTDDDEYEPEEDDEDIL